MIDTIEYRMFIKDVKFENAALACCVIIGRTAFEIHLPMHEKMCMDAQFFVQSIHGFYRADRQASWGELRISSTGLELGETPLCRSRCCFAIGVYMENKPLNR
jgi:hypothetical protein